jgi:hypothetical protein
MLPGRANRSHDSEWHLGQSFGGVTAPSGSNPQLRHCNWNTVVGRVIAAKGSYLRKCPCDANRSMLIDISKTPCAKALAIINRSPAKQRSKDDTTAIFALLVVVAQLFHADLTQPIFPKDAQSVRVAKKPQHKNVGARATSSSAGQDVISRDFAASAAVHFIDPQLTLERANGNVQAGSRVSPVPAALGQCLLDRQALQGFHGQAGWDLFIAG